MNFSRQRKKILETMTKNPVHPTAEYIYERLKEDDSDIGIATVYRNLNTLSEKGTIRKINGLEGSTHYDHNTTLHYHFFCTNCKKIYDLPDDIAPDIVKKAERLSGFKIDTHEIVFHGTCMDCMNKKEN